MTTPQASAFRAASQGAGTGRIMHERAVYAGAGELPDEGLGCPAPALAAYYDDLVAGGRTRRDANTLIWAKLFGGALGYYDRGAATNEPQGGNITIATTANTAPDVGITTEFSVTPASGAVATTSVFYLGTTSGAVTPSFPLGTHSRAINSPFTQLSRKVDEAAPRLSHDIADKLKNFVQRLLTDESDLTDEGVIPKLAAFDGLTAFLVRHPWVRMPGLTITREGAFAAFWDYERKARIRLDFIDATRVRWVVVNTGAAPANGTGEVDQIALDAIIEAYNAKEWMSA
jgi:hypothetical protein